MWFNLLLPNCCEIPEEPSNEGSQAVELIPVPKEDAVQTFEKILVKMLEGEHLIHFPYIAPEELYDRKDPDNSNIDYWGYLRNYPPKKDQTKAFPALVFRKDDFKKFAADFLEEDDDSEYIIKTLRDRHTAYCFKTDKMGFPEKKGDKTKTSALILQIDEMSFLPDDTKRVLLARIPEAGNQTSKS